MSAARSRRANDKHNHLQRTPILVMGCSLLIACCIAFGGTNWTASAQPSEDQLPEQNAIVEPGYYQETIGSYEAISQSDDDERAENLRLAAEAINGYVIEPGATFSFCHDSSRASASPQHRSDEAARLERVAFISPTQQKEPRWTTRLCKMRSNQP